MDDRLEAAFLAEVSPQDHHRFGDQLKADLSAACARQGAFAEIPSTRDLCASSGARRDADVGWSGSLFAGGRGPLPGLRVSGWRARCGGCPHDAAPLGDPACDRVHGAQTERRRDQQGVLTDLLVGSAGRPRIGAYAGRAPLARWVEVVAQRAALVWLRSERTRATVSARAGFEPPLGGDTPMEAAFFRERMDAFERSLKEALTSPTGSGGAAAAHGEQCERREDWQNAGRRPVDRFPLAGQGARKRAGRPQVHSPAASGDRVGGDSLWPTCSPVGWTSRCRSF